jgi:hypothetical protein
MLNLAAEQVVEKDIEQDFKQDILPDIEHGSLTGC